MPLVPTFKAVRATAAAAIAVLAALAAFPAAAQPPASPIGAFLAGHSAAARKDTSLAARFYLQALAADPNNPQILQPAFVNAIGAGMMTEAADLAGRLSARGQNSPVVTLMLAGAAFKKNDAAAAKRQVTGLREEGAERLLRPILLAWAEVAAKNPEAAQEAMRELNGVADFQPFHDFHAALIWDASGRDAEAERAYARALQTRSPPARLVMAAASFYARTGKKEAGRKIVAELAATSPDSTSGEALAKRYEAGRMPPRLVANAAEGMGEILYNLAATLQSEGAGDVAIVYARLAEFMRPADAGTLYLVGSLLEGDGQLDAAVASYRKIPADADNAWLARLSEATTLAQLKRIEEAARILDAMGRERPERWDALALLGSVYRADKQWAKAVEAYDRAMARLARVEERHWNLFYSRGIALERSKNWPRAEADFKRALELRPDEPYVLNYLAYTWVDRGENLEQAMQMLLRAVSLKPEDGAITDSVGWAYYRLGQYDKAVEYLERAIELQPDDPTINDHLGDAYWKVGRLYEARFQWSRALSFNPEPEDLPKIQEKVRTGRLPDEPGKKP